MTGMIVGTCGVGLLLVAFGLNLLGKLSQTSRSYLILNIVGALLAAYYAWSGRMYPFFVLELIWVAAALVRLMNRSVRSSGDGD